MNCDCPEWKENIKHLNGCIDFAFIHGVKLPESIVFKFCPWCGKELLEDK